MEHATRKPLHPLIVVAAIAVILFCAVGIAAITGLIPTSRSTAQPALESATEPAAKPDQRVSEPAAQPSARVSEAARERAPAPHATTKPAPSRTAQANPPREVAAPPQPYEPAPRAAAEPVQPAPPAICRECGVIESVREVKQQGQGSGVGAVAGGVAGAVLGHQVGSGRGRDLATVVGAVGGAVAGHQVEKQVKADTSYQISVRMDDGSVRTIHQATPPAWRIGDRVRVQGERLTSEG